MTYIDKIRPETIDFLPVWIRKREDFLKVYYKDITN